MAESNPAGVTALSRAKARLDKAHEIDKLAHAKEAMDFDVAAGKGEPSPRFEAYESHQLEGVAKQEHLFETDEAMLFERVKRLAEEAKEAARVAEMKNAEAVEEIRKWASTLKTSEEERALALDMLKAADIEVNESSKDSESLSVFHELEAHISEVDRLHNLARQQKEKAQELGGQVKEMKAHAVLLDAQGHGALSNAENDFQVALAKQKELDELLEHHERDQKKLDKARLQLRVFAERADVKAAGAELALVSAAQAAMAVERAESGLVQALREHDLLLRRAVQLLLNAKAVKKLQPSEEGNKAPPPSPALSHEGSQEDISSIIERMRKVNAGELLDLAHHHSNTSKCLEQEAVGRAELVQRMLRDAKEAQEKEEDTLKRMSELSEAAKALTEQRMNQLWEDLRQSEDFSKIETSLEAALHIREG